MAKRKDTLTMPADQEVSRWLQRIADYDRQFERWEKRADKIIRRYRDDDRDGRGSNLLTRFNILWSNVQTLAAATFARLPKPDVSRRFSDQDPVGRVAALILERALDYEIQHYSDYRATMAADVLDRFLGGRGSAWVRYEPHFKALKVGLPPDGVQVTEDQEAEGETEAEEIDYECAPCDYVHWRDFGHTVARTWEEVTGVWRIVYLTREQCTERFGEELGDSIPLDSKPESIKQTSSTLIDYTRAKIIEIWDKERKEALWLCPSMGKIIDRRPDPLGLDEFWPCPRPMYATLTTESLVPVPDFALYQDQANELNILADRIDGLVKALRVRGVYDATQPELQRLLTEGDNNAMIPVKNWAAFAEKQGLKGSVDFFDITILAQALLEAYKAFEQVKNQVYELTGISDIVRGQTQASETATAQQIKGQYATLRLKSYQDEVARFASDLLKIKAQIICGKFDLETIAKMAAVEQLNQVDQQYIGPAFQLLLGPRIAQPDADAPNPMRNFRIEVASDSLVYMDEAQEKADRMEFLTATGGFIQQIAQAALQAPQIVPMAMEMLKFGVTGFRVGRQMEGQFDAWAQQMTQAAMAPKPAPVDPKAETAKMQAQVDSQVIPMKAQAEVAKAQAGVQQAHIDQQTAVIDAAAKFQQMQMAAMQPRPMGGGNG